MELFEDKGMGGPGLLFARIGLLCFRESPWIGIDRAGVLGESDHNVSDMALLSDSHLRGSALSGGRIPRHDILPA